MSPETARVDRQSGPLGVPVHGPQEPDQVGRRTPGSPTTGPEPSRKREPGRVEPQAAEELILEAQCARPTSPAPVFSYASVLKICSA